MEDQVSFLGSGVFEVVAGVSQAEVTYENTSTDSLNGSLATIEPVLIDVTTI